MKNQYDVIIIGSGIGGLASAGILVSHGLKVLLIEKEPSPGGYLASFRRKEFIFDSAVDCIAGVQPNGFIQHLLQLLKVDKEIEFRRVHPIRLSIFPDISIPVDSELTDYLQQLTGYFPQESEGLKKLFAEADTAYYWIQNIMDSYLTGDGTVNSVPPNIWNMMNRSYQSFLDEYLHDQRLKSILSDRCTFLGVAPSVVSTLSMLAMMLSYFHQGAYRPVSGFQKLADILAKGIQNHGGEIIYQNPVTAIRMKSQEECAGVECKNGREYFSKYLISNMDFIQTFRELLGEEYARFLPPLLKNPGISISFFLVYLGIAGEMGKHSSIGYYSSYDLEKYFQKENFLREDSTIGITIASIEDPSRAPRDHHTVVLHGIVPEPEMPIDKSQATDSAIRLAEKVFPGLREKIVYQTTSTPATLYKYTGNHQGAAYGWKPVPGIRNSSIHGIRNLFISSHWGEMGGGVLASAYQGLKSAREILTLEGINRAL